MFCIRIGDAAEGQANAVQGNREFFGDRGQPRMRRAAVAHVIFCVDFKEIKS